MLYKDTLSQKNSSCIINARLIQSGLRKRVRIPPILYLLLPSTGQPLPEGARSSTVNPWLVQQRSHEWSFATMRIHPLVEGLQLDRTRIARARWSRARVHLLRICGQMRGCSYWPSLVNSETSFLLRMPGNEILNTLSSRQSAHPCSSSSPSSSSSSSSSSSTSTNNHVIAITVRRSKTCVKNHGLCEYRLDEVTTSFSSSFFFNSWFFRLAKCSRCVEAWYSWFIEEWRRGWGHFLLVTDAEDLRGSGWEW